MLITLGMGWPVSSFLLSASAENVLKVLKKQFQLKSYKHVSILNKCGILRILLLKINCDLFSDKP